MRILTILRATKKYVMPNQLKDRCIMFRPNDRNISTQHIVTLLGAPSCTRMAALLRRVVTSWLLLTQILKWSNVSQQHPTCCNRVAKRAQHVAPNNWCCVDMLRSFGRGLKAFQMQRKISFLANANLRGNIFRPLFVKKVTTPQFIS